MKQVPHITQAHLDAANRHFISQRYSSHAEFVNKAIEIALAEQSQEQYITALQARKIGWGKVEYFNELTNAWHFVPTHIIGNEKFKYRAIKQPESVEPHAELKANLVKLDGKLVTREAAIAEWDSKKDTCDLYFVMHGRTDWMKFVSLTECEFGSQSEYQLRPKPLKQIDWASVPVGVMLLPKGASNILQLRRVHGLIAHCENKEGKPMEMRTTDMHLAPSEKQIWIAVQDDDPHTMRGKEKWLANHGIMIKIHDGNQKYRITGTAEGWKL